MFKQYAKWALLLIVVLSVVLAACGPTPAPTKEAAPEPTEEAAPKPTEPEAKRPFEGQTLKVLTWEGYVPDEVKEAFEAETGATVEITYISDNGELISKLRATGGEGWDVASPSVNEVPAAQELYDIYQPIDPSRIPNFANAIDSLEARVADYTTIDGERFSIPFTWGTSGLIVNTARVDEPVTSYKQLCDAKYAGRVTYRYRYPTFAGAAYGLGYDLFSYGEDVEKWREIMYETLDYLINCKGNVKAYWTTRQENIDLLLSEEAWLAQGWDGTGWLLSKENPAIKFIAPDEGALGWVDTFSIPAGAENIDLAYAWIEFNYRPEIAGQVIAGGGFLSAIEGAVDLLDADQAALINESFPPAAIDNINWYPPLIPDIVDINDEVVEKLRAAVAPEEGAPAPTEEPTAAPEAGAWEAEGLADLPDLSGQTLRILTWEGYVPDEIKEAFEAATGATVEITYISDNGELISKLRATGGEGWDVASPSVDNVRVAQELYEIYQPIDLNRIPNLSNVIESLDARVKDYSTVNGERYSIPFTWGTSGLIVNTARVDEPVTSYKQLCDSKYAGRVTYRYRYPTFVGASYGLGYDLFSYADNPDKWREIMEATLQYLIDCKPNVKAYWTTRQENIDLLLSEEAWLAQGWDGTGWLLSKENPAIKFIAPDEGALGWVDTFSIPAGAENLEAAYAWINFNLLAKNAGKLIEGGGFLSAVKGAVDYLPAEQAALITESFPPAAIDNINWYPPVTAEIDDINAEMVEKLRAAVGE